VRQVCGTKPICVGLRSPNRKLLHSQFMFLLDPETIVPDFLASSLRKLFFARSDKLSSASTHVLEKVGVSTEKVLVVKRDSILGDL